MDFDKVMLMSPMHTPFIGTIVSPGGYGKTSWAALFPSPAFIRTEKGTKSLIELSRVNPAFDLKTVAEFPLCETSEDVKQQLNWLRTEKHSRKTVVIDTVTQMDTMIQMEVLKADPKAKGMNQAFGGYGNGWDHVAKAHWDIRDLCEKLAEERNVNVLFLAHEVLETVDSPETESFMRSSLRLHKKSIQPYTDNVDVVAFIKLEAFVTGEEKKRATGTGRRLISCYATPSNVGKNRFGITADISFDLSCNPFEQFLGGK